MNAEATKIGKEAEEANAIATQVQLELDKALPALQVRCHACVVWASGVCTQLCKRQGCFHFLAASRTYAQQPCLYAYQTLSCRLLRRR